MFCKIFDPVLRAVVDPAGAAGVASPVASADDPLRRFVKGDSMRFEAFLVRGEGEQGDAVAVDFDVATAGLGADVIGLFLTEEGRLVDSGDPPVRLTITFGRFAVDRAGVGFGGTHTHRRAPRCAHPVHLPTG